MTMIRVIIVRAMGQDNVRISFADQVDHDSPLLFVRKDVLIHYSGPKDFCVNNGGCGFAFCSANAREFLGLYLQITHVAARKYAHENLVALRCIESKSTCAEDLQIIR